MDIGTKVRFINRNPERQGEPGTTATVVKAKPHECKKKGKRMDGVIVPKVFLELDNEFKTRAWFPIEWLEPVA